MGYTLKGVCSCGYQPANLYFGATQQGVLRYCIVPALDYDKSIIVGKDLMDINDADNKVSYTDPMLSKSEKKSGKFQFGNVFINKIGNYCPNCGEFSLEFKLIYID